MSRRDLFPPIEPFATGTLAVDARHTLYWEQSGNPQGLPVVFLHGGPGAGATPTHRRFFDPASYRIIIFDQRGAGRSTPLGELIDNTTAHLVRDIEALRSYFAIDRWIVFGGSWGSTLALNYAVKYPARCRALILRGIFLCRQSEIDWFLYGIRQVFPEAWRSFAAPIPEDERDDLLTAYYRRLTDPDPAVHLPAARCWSTYEGACSTLLPSADGAAAFGEDRMALGLARIEAHYFRHEIVKPDSDLVVATPERVSFDYQVAGLGTRALAQVLDMLIVSGILVAVYFVAVAVSLAAVVPGQLIAIAPSTSTAKRRPKPITRVTP